MGKTKKKNNASNKTENLYLEGTVTKKLPGDKFQVVPEGVTTELICSTCGKIKQNHISITVGDRVSIEVSPYDLHKGIIRFRN